MARMFPEAFPPELAADRGRAAERKLYDALASELPDDYLVIHGVHWYVPREGRGFREGECDFVVAHPGHGALVLEVKGGRLAYDAAHGRWTSTDRDGREHPLARGPFEQASAARRMLAQLVRSQPGWRDAPEPVGWAVALPDCAKTPFTGPDAPGDLVLDADDLLRPLEAVERAFAALALGAGELWRDNGLALLERLLCGRRFARVSLGTRVHEHEVEMLRLTTEQARILDLLAHQRRAAISGCAGSGKTMLAVEKARRLAGQGLSVLLTCFNRPLAEFIQSQLPLPTAAARRRGDPRPVGEGQLDLFAHARVDVVTFHALAGSWAHRAGIALDEPDEAGARDRFFREMLPEALLRAAGRVSDRYDAIVVDEGQDFLEDWWTPLQSLLADPDGGILYVFFDDNQSLYTAGARLPIETPPFVLTANCRNTREIHRFVVDYYRGSVTPRSEGPEGTAPERLTYRHERELREHLRRTLHRMIHDERIAERDLVVLTPFGRARSALWRDPAFGNVRLTDTWPPAPGHVQCATVHAFKGLERPVVVLAELARDASVRAEEMLYVGGSRAKSHLVVIAEG